MKQFSLLVIFLFTFFSVLSAQRSNFWIYSNMESNLPFQCRLDNKLIGKKRAFKLKVNKRFDLEIFIPNIMEEPLRKRINLTSKYNVYSIKFKPSDTSFYIAYRGAYKGKKRIPKEIKREFKNIREIKIDFKKTSLLKKQKVNKSEKNKKQINIKEVKKLETKQQETKKLEVKKLFLKPKPVDTIKIKTKETQDQTQDNEAQTQGKAIDYVAVVVPITFEEAMEKLTEIDDEVLRYQKIKEWFVHNEEIEFKSVNIAQIKAILRGFKTEVYIYELLKYLYPYCSQKSDYIKLENILKYESFKEMFKEEIKKKDTIAK